MNKELNNNNIEKRLFSIKEAAVYLGRSQWSIAEMVRSGRIPYIPEGRRRFIDFQDLQRYIEINKTRNID